MHLHFEWFFCSTSRATHALPIRYPCGTLIEGTFYLLFIYLSIGVYAAPLAHPLRTPYILSTFHFAQLRKSFFLFPLAKIIHFLLFSFPKMRE